MAPRPRRWSAALVAGAALAGLAACADDPVRRAERDAAALVAGVVPAEDPRDTGWPPKPHTRVLVTREGIDADDAALFASWPAKDRADLLRELPDETEDVPFVHKDILKLSAGRVSAADDPGPGLELRPLRAVLDYASSLEMIHGSQQGEDASQRAANVYIDRDAPYLVAVQVLYTVVQAGYSAVPVIRSPSGEAALRIDTPRVGDARECPTPLLTVLSGGVSVEIEKSRADRAAEIAAMRDALDDVDLSRLLDGKGVVPRRPKRPRRAPNLAGRPILGPDGACPSVPRAGGRIDDRRLIALLRDIAAATPPCDRAFVRATPATTWGDVVGVVSATREAGFERVQFRTAKAEDPAQDACSGAITPADLHEAQQQRGAAR